MPNEKKRKNTEQSKDSVKKYCRGCNVYSLRKTDERVSHRQQILERAVENGDIEDVKTIIETFGLSYSNELNSYKLLCDALQYRYPEIAKLLLTNGAKVNIESKDRFDTPLHLAVRFGYTEIASMLIDRNANVNALDLSNWKAFTYAVHQNSIDIMKLLINQNVPIDKPLIKGMPPLFYAVEHKYFEMAEILLNHGACVNIVRRSSSMNSKCMPLHLAVFNENESLVELLLNKGAEINSKMANNKTPLHIAAASGNAKIVTLLSKRGANVDAKLKNGDGPLHIAVNIDSMCVIKVLLANKANCNIAGKDDAMPIHLAVRKKSLKVVEMLLDSGANIDSKLKNGTTALHIACKIDNIEIIALLCKRNANIDAEDKDKCTPFHHAIAYNHCSTDILDILIEFGANVEAKNIQGRTALHLAAIHGCPEATDSLLFDYGADVNVTCNDMMTPLDYAKFGVSNDIDITYGRTCDDYREVVDTLYDYIISRTALGLDVTEKYRKVINRSKTNREFMNKCRTRVAGMKTERIGDSFVTVYDILTANINKLATYTKNDKFVKTARGHDIYKGRGISTYNRMYDVRIIQGVKRKKLLSSSLISFTSLLGYNLPDIAVIEILYYLSNKDLENLIIANSSDKDYDL